MKPSRGNDIVLGNLSGYPDGSERELRLLASQRDKHLYIVGSTGTGKSKLLENLIRQDILAWSRSKCGLIVIDPHGSLYDGLIAWLTRHDLKRPIVPIDLRQRDWVVAYNLLRQRQTAEATVLVDNLVDAIAYVWGQTGTNQTPLFARWATNVLGALYEKELTLVQAELLLDRVAKQTRYALTSDLSDRLARQDWRYADTLNAKDFDAQLGSTANRIQRFIKNPNLRAMFGQPNVSLDFGRALDEGSIILVSLATESAKISEENAAVFATLMLSDLWTAAKERGKKDGVKPFYVYVDEFQQFITPTIAENLDQARGFGLHMTLAHQYPGQLSDRGESGQRVYSSVMETAASKVCFRLSSETNLKPMAEWLFRGVMDPNEIKHVLSTTKIMGYREEKRETITEGRTSGSSRGSQRGRAGGSGVGGTENFHGDGTDDIPLGTSISQSEFLSESESESKSFSDSRSISRSVGSFLIPEFGKEDAHVQFNPLADQLFRAMGVLFDQQERQGVARLVGMKAPVSIHTPNVASRHPTKAEVKRYLAKHYKKLSYAIKGDTALALVEKNQNELLDKLLNAPEWEPTASMTKIRRKTPTPEP